MKVLISTYWANLTDRERWMLGVGIVCCLLFLYYVLFYSPLTGAVRRESQLLIEKQETLLWMEHIKKGQQKTRAKDVLTSSKLLTLLAEQLNKSPFKQFPYQLQQTGISDITLVFDQVPYNAIMAWAWSFNTKYSISIKQLTILKTESPGIVKLTLNIALK